MKSYQNLFNEHLKKIRLITNALGNKALGDTIIKLMFDFSDELKSQKLLKGDKDDDESHGNK